MIIFNYNNLLFWWELSFVLFVGVWGFLLCFSFEFYSFYCFLSLSSFLPLSFSFLFLSPLSLSFCLLDSITRPRWVFVCGVAILVLLLILDSERIVLEEGGVVAVGIGSPLGTWWEQFPLGPIWTVQINIMLFLFLFLKKNAWLMFKKIQDFNC